MLLFLLLIGLDQLTKAWADHRGWVVFNSGLAFGWGGERVEIGILLVILAVVVYSLRHRTLPQWFWSLFLAGVVSNLIDRWFLAGQVRDWLPVPGLGLVNNLADWYIGLAITIYGIKYGYEHRHFI